MLVEIVAKVNNRRALQLKALYQHNIIIIETMTFIDVFFIFLGQENGNVHIHALRIAVL